MFDYLELAKELDASIKEKMDTGLKGAQMWWKFEVVVDEVNFNILAKNDSHYDVKEGMIRFLVCSHMTDKFGQPHYMKNAPSINVSAKKTPVQVAAEVRRRLLNPEAVEQICKFQESVHRMEERTDAKIQMMQRAAQLVYSSESVGPNTEKVWTSSNFPVQFTVSNWLDNRVKLDSVTLTIEQLEKICKVLTQ